VAHDTQNPDASTNKYDARPPRVENAVPPAPGHVANSTKWKRVLGRKVPSASLADGPSTTALVQIADRCGISLLAGLFERGEDGEVYKAQICVDKDGLKGRAWLMKWLPARAYDNGIYAVFSNPIGMDDDQLKNGCSMVIDPFGDVLAECRSLGNDVVTATCTHAKIARSGGQRYRAARKPELYHPILGAAHQSQQSVVWMEKDP
jgi:hypothetical protein